MTDLHEGIPLTEPKADAPPPPPDHLRHEHFTCATGHYAAERVLRIVERHGVSDFEQIEMLNILADRAGAHFCRRALEDEVPF